MKSSLNIQFDKANVMRCHGIFATKEFQPIILPKNHPSTFLVIDQVHRSLMHARVSQTLADTRSEFWIPQGRTQVRKVIQKCKICHRFAVGPYQLPPMAVWPKEKVSRSTPFAFTGLDYLGPLFLLKKTHNKVWVCLFTRITIRAIHLELVDSLNAEQCLMVIRRFIARR